MLNQTNVSFLQVIPTNVICHLTNTRIQNYTIGTCISCMHTNNTPSSKTRRFPSWARNYVHDDESSEFFIRQQILLEIFWTVLLQEVLYHLTSWIWPVIVIILLSQCLAIVFYGSHFAIICPSMGMTVGVILLDRAHMYGSFSWTRTVFVWG